MSTPPPPPVPDVVSVNSFRLSPGQWLAAAGLIVIAIGLTPRVWKKTERFDTGPDYRIPYALSRDYWLFERRMQEHAIRDRVILLGDSVVWGEYVSPRGTLSHFLNDKAPDRFVNGGINGLFPLALEGLIGNYGKAIRKQKVLLHCNLLWMSSPSADLQSRKEERFNHARLVPQFHPCIPCYRADGNERLSAIVERNLEFSSWVGHLQSAYFADKSIPVWTLQEDPSNPERHPNAWRNPMSRITRVVPEEPDPDPNRGPASPRHKPWTSGSSGSRVGFEWVTLESSLQWRAFQRLVDRLRERNCDLFVVLGPFNEHMIAPESIEGYGKLRDGVRRWMEENKVPHSVPAVLPTDLYADASHPLTDGYRLLASELWDDPACQKWLH